MIGTVPLELLVYRTGDATHVHNGEALIAIRGPREACASLIETMRGQLMMLRALAGDSESVSPTFFADLESNLERAAALLVPEEVTS